MTGFTSKRQAAWDKYAEPWNGVVGWEAFEAGWNAGVQRPWVGLTEDEIWSAVSRIGTSKSDVNPYQTIADARAIEAKLKELNT